MGAVDDWVKYAKQYDSPNVLTGVTSQAINRAIKMFENEILSLNTRSQLYNRGIDGEGNALTPEYADSTKKRKSRLGQPTDRVTLRDTGRFHDSFKIFYGSNYIEFGADPRILRRDFDLVSHLQKRYGKDIFGLTPENVNKLRDLIMVELEKLIKNGK